MRRYKADGTQWKEGDGLQATYTQEELVRHHGRHMQSVVIAWREIRGRDLYPQSQTGFREGALPNPKQCSEKEPPQSQTGFREGASPIPNRVQRRSPP